MENLESIRKSNLLRIVYLAVSFMMLFTAFVSAQNMMIQIYQQLGHDSLGQYCFFSIFIGVILSSLVSTYYHQQIPTKVELVGGAATYVALLACGALATFCDKYKSDTAFCEASFIYGCSITIAFLLGVGISFFWLAQATYVNACADEQTRGTSNGIFFSLLQVSQILSSLIATFVLGKADQFTFYCVLLVFGFISLVMLCFIKDPIPFNTAEKQKVPENQETLNDSLKSFLNTLCDKKYYFLFMGIIFSGTAVTFYATSLGTIVSSTIDYEPTNIINQKTGLVFLVLAITEVVAGLTVGRLADKYNKIKVLAIIFVVNETGLLLTFLAYSFKTYNFSLLAGAFWGFGDTGINTMLNVIIGSRFNASPELFSCFRFLQSSGCLLTSIFGIFMLKVSPILYMIVIAGGMVALQLIFYSYQPKDEEKTKDYIRLEEEKIMVELKNL